MKNGPEDRSFNDIANKFQKNIYGSTKGRLRHELLLHHLAQHTSIAASRLQILDAGGGTGVMAESLLNMQHSLTLTDISQETLDIAADRLGRFDKLSILKSDILSLPQKQYDLVICHAVLEWVEKPKAVLEKLASLVKPHGFLSVSFFNRDAQLFGNMCYGNFDYVEQGMQVKNRVRLTPNNPLKPKDVLTEFAALPLSIKLTAGIRCFHDYLRDLDKQEKYYPQLKSLEIQYGDQEPYLWLGKYFQIIAQKV
ncbi:methyltransferase [Paraglaciecola aquimarina]|uniref:tRNA 5-carboxymethoxyuridine methyltransferase n=1 Tax=Paraglaciecola aquimarina TaxID=1235557 RepID=A0ABU3SZ43_9ALTE|nr:methyltransferase [Paraglaciecola aquimarina]MDU0355288.1 methyltransferase [Paraglaciecola aquimarina]